MKSHRNAKSILNSNSTKLASNKINSNNQNNINNDNKNENKKDSNQKIINKLFKNRHIDSLNTIEKKVYKDFKYYYSNDKDFYNIKVINEIICNDNTHIVAVFKDYLINGDYSEFLQKFYKLKCSIESLPKIFEYYDSCSVIFPNYVVLPESKYIYKNIQRKQRVIDNQQELEEEQEKIKNGLIKDEKEETVFTTQAYDSILNQTNTSIARKIFGANNIDIKEENNLSLEKLIKKIDKAEKNSKYFLEKKVFNINLKKNDKNRIIKKDKILLDNLSINSSQRFKGRNYKRYINMEYNSCSNNNINKNNYTVNSKGIRNFIFNLNNTNINNNNNKFHHHKISSTTIDVDNSTKNYKTLYSSSNKRYSNNNNNNKTITSHHMRNYSNNFKKSLLNSILSNNNKRDMVMKVLKNLNSNNNIHKSKHNISTRNHKKRNNFSPHNKSSLDNKNKKLNLSNSSNSINPYNSNHNNNKNDGVKIKNNINNNSNNFLFNNNLNNNDIPLTLRENHSKYSINPEIKQMINSKINKIKNLTNKKNNSLTHKKTFSSTSTVTATTSYGNKPKENKSNNNLEKCSSKKNSSYITVNSNNRKKNISSNFISNTTNTKSKLNNINNTNIIYSPKSNNIPKEKTSNNSNINNSIKNINKVDHFSVSPKKYYDFNKMIKNFSHYKSSSNIQSNNISNNKKRKPSNQILPFKKESNIKGITIKRFEEILKSNNLNYNKNNNITSSERNKQISKSKTNRNIYNKNYIEYFKKRNKY